MTERERAAALAYVRLLRTTRAVLADSPGPSHAASAAPPPSSASGLALLTAPLAEADEALDALGMAGNEAEFFRLVARTWPVVPEEGRS
ncbi:hypothetical protein ACFVIM_29370 [Streptomyces sp. NPDC057638]|uniref:hypothetical protein n=1 Tax=Streptomyces sp. NPDC057638 TaxID=3346190 RepID=UPI0036B4706E